MYDTEYVDKIIKEYQLNLKQNINHTSHTLQYLEFIELGARSFGERIQLLYKAVLKSIPIEIELDYVFMKTNPIGDKENPKGMSIRIFGSEDRIETFNFEKTFESKYSDKGVASWIASVFELLIKNEYALANLEFVNEIMETYCRRARLNYIVSFTTDVSTNNLLHSISDTNLVINTNIDSAISIANTVLFESKQKTLKKDIKTKLDLEMIDQLRLLKNPLLFLNSKYPVYLYLTKLTKSIDPIKLIRYTYPNKLETTNIGYVETDTTIGIKNTDWILAPINKETLERE